MLAATATATVAGVAVPTLIDLGRVAAPGSVEPAGSPSAAAPYTPAQVETAYGDNSDFFQRSCRQRRRTDDRNRRRVQRPEHR